MQNICQLNIIVVVIYKFIMHFIYIERKCDLSDEQFVHVRN